MGDLLVELVPFAVGMAVTPSAIAVGILFLGSRRPVGNALEYAAAFAVVYGGLAALVIAASAAATEPLFSDEDKSVAALIVGLVLVALGVATVVRHWLGGSPKRSRLLAAVDEASPAEAFGMGLVLAVLNPNVPILFGGLATCVAADVSDAARSVGAALLVLASLLLLVGPVVWYLLDRARAEHGRARLKGWLNCHQTAVDVAVLLGFGVLFTGRGLAGL